MIHWVSCARNACYVNLAPSGKSDFDCEGRPIRTRNRNRLLEDIHLHGLLKKAVGQHAQLWTMASGKTVDTLTEALGVLGGNARPKSQ